MKKKIQNSNRWRWVESCKKKLLRFLHQILLATKVSVFSYEIPLLLWFLRYTCYGAKKLKNVNVAFCMEKWRLMHMKKLPGFAG